MTLDTGSYVVCGVVTVAAVAAYMVWQQGASKNRKGETLLMRDVLLLLLVTATFAISLTLLKGAVGAGSPFFGGIVFFVALGWTVFAQPVMGFRVPGAIREIRPWELRGVLYRALGVPGFGVMLRASPLKLLNPSVHLGKFPGEPATVCRNLEISEANHLWGGLLTLPYLVYASLHGWWGVFIVSLVLHVVANLYPICHLRWARGRLARYAGRKALGKTKTTSHR
jgi:hypothetical protein